MPDSPDKPDSANTSSTPEYVAHYRILCRLGKGGCVCGYPVRMRRSSQGAAQKAVDADPTLAEAYTSRAFVRLAYDWDWLGAQNDFQQALKLNPKYLYSYYEHNYDDAIAKYKLTLQSDPDFWVARHYLALAYVQKRMHSEAIAELRKLIKAPETGGFTGFAGCRLVQRALAIQT